MQLPLENPPSGTMVTRSGNQVVLTRSLVTSPFQHQLTLIPIAAFIIFGMITGARVAASKLPAMDVLLSPVTFATLLILVVPTFLAARIIRRQGVSDVLILEPNRLQRKNLRYGIEESADLQKNRITRLIRSRPRNADGSLYGGGSVEAEYRAEGGETKEFQLMYSVTRSDAEVDWYVKVFEGWTGMRARVEDFTIDTDDDEIEEEGDDNPQSDSDIDPQHSSR